MKEASMLGKKASGPQSQSDGTPITLLTIAGSHAKVEGKFDISDSIQIECEVGGELNVAGRLVIGEKGIVNADVKTVEIGRASEGKSVDLGGRRIIKKKKKESRV